MYGNLAILGSPVIDITSGGYALYGSGIDISGGKITAKNTSSGFVLCSGSQKELNIRGEADVTIELGISGVQASDAFINDGGNAKLKILNVTRNPLFCGGLNVSGKALRALWFWQADGFTHGGKGKCSAYIF